jgi:hypothetical protein
MHSQKRNLLEIRKEYESADGRGRGAAVGRASEADRAESEVPDPGVEPRAGASGSAAAKARAQVWRGCRVGVVQLWEIFDFPCGQRLAPTYRSRTVERKWKGR